MHPFAPHFLSLRNRCQTCVKRLPLHSEDWKHHHALKELDQHKDYIQTVEERKEAEDNVLLSGMEVKKKE